ncbi:MAG: Crp/Fnr family transcriptional regulator [Rhodocyclaceae bacterium]|nr:Crp/Fnr family transcriptional regulator [Rhodocyclaceae bacterium]MCA3076886.1 Crp/Fnr family transcriptional regulator [Rhodocyclaceae bacterium]MCA3091065.1 Crp/Fnr family transcriptional regulator [Rhodocyclaceae bacterium]MCA3095213.1 Crp/Fnr family transcriptional regulator [Rhodocyclaceae bacterium]MCA3099612.1 Crp/Fnr family transcriptional regulator [Rhodocyclaceae bacterium]
MLPRPRFSVPASPTVIATLRLVPFFAALPESDLQRLASTARQRKCPKNTVIMSQGDDTDSLSLYIIASGRIKVGISDEEGKEVILSILGPGQFFGEMSLVDDHPRSANIETMEASEFVVVNKDDFKRFLSQNFDMALSFMKELVRRLREADKKIESLALMDVYGRVARVLLDMAEETVDGRLMIKRRLTKQDIARMIGASREMVSRVMKDLVEMNHVSFQGSVIVLNENLAESTR